MLEELSLPLPHPREATVVEVDVATLVEAHASTLFRVAHALLRNRAEAEDVVQDTFVRVLEHRRKLPAVRELRPWLIRITWNLALDRRRRVRPDQADQIFLEALITTEVPADQALQAAEHSRAVLAALDRLADRERQALLLSAIDELPTSEIAQSMGTSESAVRALVHRARTQLRTRLQKGGKR